MSLTPNSSRRGQATVEMALMFLTFIWIIVGIAEFSRLAAVYVSMLNAAREGARVGSVAGASDADITAAIQSSILAFGSGLSTITPTICPDAVGGSSSSCTPLTGTVTRASGGALVVTISYTFQFIPPMDIFLPSGITLSATGVTVIS